MKRLIAFLLCIVMLFALCACSANKPEPTQEPSAEPTPSYESVSFENHGKKITVDSMPQKVVTAGPNCTEVFCALGLSDLVVGKCMSNHSTGALEELSEDFYTIPDISVGYPTLDELIASGCDFLYATDWIFGENLTIKSLEKAGITVFVSNCGDIGGLYEDIRTIAKIFEVSDTAEKIIAKDAAIISAVSEKLPEEKLRVLVLDSFIDDLIYVAGSNAFENSIIEAAGGKNVFAELEKPWDAVTVEEIMAAQPDFIIIHDYQDSASADKLAALKEHPWLSHLACVRNGAILEISLENSFPGVRSGITVETLSSAMYPDIFE